MSDQNQQKTNTNNNPPSGGGSLLQRVSNNQTQTNNNPPQNAPNNTPPTTRPFGGASRFGGGSSSNANNNQNNPPAQNNTASSPFRSLPTREQIEVALLPIYKVAVRFELKGLGDPFYRLLGHEVNTEYGDSRVVARKLEQGGEDVEALRAVLDSAWGKYPLEGAVILYPMEHENLIKQLNAPNVMPKKENFFDDDDDDKKEEQPKPAMKVIRALDPILVLNVLARARTQVLLKTSPLVLSQQYLNRAIVTDDPRLVALAMATGVLS